MFKNSRSLSILIAMFSGVALSSHAYSQEGGIEFLDPEAVMGITKNVHLNIVDEVDGECWTNAGVIKQEARNILTNNGVSVSLEPLASNNLMNAEIKIGALGYRTQGICVGYVSLSLKRPFIHESYSIADGGHKYIYLGTSTDLEWGFVASGALLNRNIRDASQEFIYQISSDIADGRRTNGAQLYINHFSEDYSAEPVTRAQRDRELRKAYEARQQDK